MYTIPPDRINIEKQKQKQNNLSICQSLIMIVKCFSIWVAKFSHISWSIDRTVTFPLLERYFAGVCTLQTEIEVHPDAPSSPSWQLISQWQSLFTFVFTRSPLESGLIYGIKYVTLIGSATYVCNKRQAIAMHHRAVCTPERRASARRY